MQLNQLKTNDSIVEFQVDGEQKQYDFDMTFIASILSDNLYSDPVKAVYRELVSNVLDAHRLAGKKDIKEAVIESTSDGTFICRDYGVGLSKESVMDIYACYGRSTKRDTNHFVGGFGIGAKSPFAIIDAFSVVSYFNGEEHSYLAYKDEKGLPSIKHLSTTKTDEPNGVKVTVPFGSRASEGKLKQVLSCYPTEVIGERGGYSVKDLTPSETYKGVYYMVGKFCDGILMGNVLYERRAPNNLTLVVPNGMFEPNPNRETLRNWDAVDTVINGVNKEYKEKHNEWFYNTYYAPLFQKQSEYSIAKLLKSMNQDQKVQIGWLPTDIKSVIQGIFTLRRGDSLSYYELPWSVRQRGLKRKPVDGKLYFIPRTNYRAEDIQSDEVQCKTVFSEYSKEHWFFGSKDAVYPSQKEREWALREFAAFLVKHDLPEDTEFVFVKNASKYLREQEPENTAFLPVKSDAKKVESRKGFKQRIYTGGDQNVAEVKEFKKEELVDNKLYTLFSSGARYTMPWGTTYSEEIVQKLGSFVVLCPLSKKDTLIKDMAVHGITVVDLAEAYEAKRKVELPWFGILAARYFSKSHGVSVDNQRIKLWLDVYEKQDCVTKFFIEEDFTYCLLSGTFKEYLKDTTPPEVIRAFKVAESLLGSRSRHVDGLTPSELDTIFNTVYDKVIDIETIKH